MKFADVQVGDTVYIEKHVTYGFNPAKTFFVLVKVVRVTKTQLVVDDGGKERRFKRDFGGEVGSSYSRYSTNIRNLGDKQSGWSDVIVKDDTEEMQKFEKQISLEVKLRNELGDLKIPKGELSLEDVELIEVRLNDIKDIINKVK